VGGWPAGRRLAFHLAAKGVGESTNGAVAMATLIFRKAVAADVPAIVGLLAADVMGKTRERVSDPVDQRYYAGFEAVAADPNQMLAVGEQDGQVIGCLQLSFLPGLSRLGAWRGQIEGVRVSADARGGGVGKAMMDWAIEQCRSRGCDLVQLTTDRRREDAQRFYLGLGFEPSHIGMKLSLGA
jgi:ribosomal protein S18 acetylase RimI-like enzyme